MDERIDRELAEHHHAKRLVKEERKALAKAKLHLAAIEQAQQICQGVAQAVQQNANAQIASVVSRCLEAVFDDPYRFEIKFHQRRGKTEAELVFLRGDLEADPMTAAGGGVVDVASFAARVACLVLSRPRLRRVLILDEPFRFLDAGRRERIGELLLALAKEMRIQFVVVTHSDQLQIGKVIQL